MDRAYIFLIGTCQILKPYYTKLVAIVIPPQVKVPFPVYLGYLHFHKLRL